MNTNETSGSKIEPRDPKYKDAIVTVPNLICLVRMLGSLALIGVAYAGKPYWFVGLYIALSLSDWLDGLLARRLKQRSDFGARLDLTLGAATEVALNLQRTLQETTERSSPGYLESQFSGRLEHRLTARLLPYLDVGYTLSDYLERGRDDRLTSLGGGLRLLLTRDTDLAIGLSHTRRDSDRSGGGTDRRDYDRLAIYLALTSRLYPGD